MDSALQSARPKEGTQCTQSPPATDLRVSWFHFAQFGSAAVSSDPGADDPLSDVTDRQEVRSSLATSQCPRHRLTSSHRVHMSSSLRSRTSTGQSHIWREREEPHSHWLLSQYIVIVVLFYH